MNKRQLTKKHYILMAIGIVILIIIAMVFNKASTRRWFRDIRSEFNNGMERTITVYDMNGDVIKEYNGKFDVEIENQKIKFDEADGTRHIVVVGSGTVCIDDKEQ